MESNGKFRQGYISAIDMYNFGFWEALIMLICWLFPLAIIAGLIFLVFRILYLVIKNLENNLKK